MQGSNTHTTGLIKRELETQFRSNLKCSILRKGK